MKKIFECVVGSIAYGTNTEASDTDIKGVYIQPNSEILGTKYIEQLNIDKDTTFYELRRFLELAVSANPTILEMLFVDDRFINIVDERFKTLILKDRHIFLTKQCYNSFAGYAFQQIQKAKGLNKKMNWEKEKTIRKDILDFCFVYTDHKAVPIKLWLKENKYIQELCGLSAINHMPGYYNVYYDFNAAYGTHTSTPEFYAKAQYKGICGDDSNDVRLSSIPKEAVPVTTMFFNKDAYSIHCKEYLSYETWLKERNESRYVDLKEHGQKIDGKNLMHCMRLINCAEEIARTGTFQVYRPEREFLLDIRKGNVSLEDIISQAEQKLAGLKQLFENSNLPDNVPKEIIHEKIVKIRLWDSKNT